MSSTIGSPALDHAVGRLVVRRRRVRATGHDRRRRPSSWPSATSRSRTSRATSASVRPDQPRPAIPGTARSAAWAALRSSSTSSASLIRRSVRQHRRGERRRALRRAPAWSAQHEGIASSVSQTRTRPGARRDAASATSAEGLSVSIPRAQVDECRTTPAAAAPAAEPPGGARRAPARSWPEPRRASSAVPGHARRSRSASAGPRRRRPAAPGHHAHARASRALSIRSWNRVAGTPTASRPAPVPSRGAPAGSGCRSARTSHDATSAAPSVKALLYEKTRSAPASSACLRSVRSSCCPTAMIGNRAAAQARTASTPS